MLGCSYCGCDALVKNGSTRGVPKWKCKNCGRQTSLKGEKGEKDQGQAETVLLYLSGLSLNAIAGLTSVVPSTALRRVRRFAQAWATKPRPGAGGVIVMELDELWHFVGSKANQLWIWLAFCRDTGQLVDWQCGDRDQATLDQLLDRLKAWKVRLYCAFIVRMVTFATIRLCRWDGTTRERKRLTAWNRSIAGCVIGWRGSDSGLWSCRRRSRGWT
jgi:transposase